MELKKLWQDIKPRTKREWFKLTIDLILLCVFLYFIWYCTSAYAEGYKIGLEYGKQNCFNLSTTLSNFT